MENIDKNLQETQNGDESFDMSTIGEEYLAKTDNIQEADIVEGKVVDITGENYIIDIGYKSEGVVPIEEVKEIYKEELPEKNSKIPVMIIRKETKEGTALLSCREAHKVIVWEKITDCYEKKETISGKIIEEIRGGLLVDLGINAFLPASQVALNFTSDLGKFVGRTLDFKIIKLDRRGQSANIVLSRKVILAEEREKKKTELFSKLEVGQLKKGIVKKIMNFGAFVDIGGVDGLLHIQDISWGRVKDISEYLTENTPVEVIVLTIDKEKEKIGLGLKQKKPSPWSLAKKKFQEGAVVEGVVTGIAPYGAFIEIEEGLEGLLHISDMDWYGRIRHPKDLFKPGDKLKVKVLMIDIENKKMSLGLKQVQEDPFRAFEKQNPPGTRIKGKVTSVKNFGVFVELGDSLEGLIHISELSWDKSVRKPSQLLSEGDWVEAAVLSIDYDKRKISLGLKQIQGNPWDNAEKEFPAGSVVKGKITSVAEFGIFIKIKDGLEGLVHISQLADEKTDKIPDKYKPGEEVSAVVLELDPKTRKISLSIKDYEHAAEMHKVKEYLDTQEKARGNLGELIEQALNLKKQKESPSNGENSVS